MDGYEAAAVILGRRPSLPILLCSAWSTTRPAAAEAAGITACLAKDEFERIAALAARLAGGDRETTPAG